MFMDSVTPNLVYNTINDLQLTNSVGTDGINIKILKACAHIVKFILASLFNWSLEAGIFPNILKIGKIVPVYKKGDPLVISNYRPISILCTISKIFERIVFDRIYTFLDKYNMLHPAQHGFVKGKSTQTALLLFISKVYSTLDKGLKSMSLFMDLSKAFDLVNHNLLLQKLHWYGLRGSIHHWLKSYLSDRKQVVVINNTISSELPVTSGVPQGSILGPLLFLLFVNDLPNNMDNNFIMYADDNTYVGAATKWEDLRTNMQATLNKLVDWFTTNNMSVNIDKSVFMKFTPKRKEADCSHLLKIDKRSIQQVTSAKFLGLYLDSDFGWLTHINNLCSKLSQACYVLYRLRNIVNVEVIKTYYYTCFESRIKYGLTFWGASSHSIRVFRMQKRAVRTMLNVPRRSSCRNLFKKLKIMPLPTCFIYETLILIKSIKANLQQNKDFHNYFTRGASDFVIPKHKLVTFENNPLYIGVKLFNALHPNLKEINNIRSFKVQLKDFLIDKCFYSLNEYFNDVH